MVPGVGSVMAYVSSLLCDGCDADFETAALGLSKPMLRSKALEAGWVCGVHSLRGPRGQGKRDYCPRCVESYRATGVDPGNAT
jgi:hypothetical protein